METWGFVEALNPFLAGDLAVTISWPPFGRWAAGYGTEEEALRQSMTRLWAGEDAKATLDDVAPIRSGDAMPADDVTGIVPDTGGPPIRRIRRIRRSRTDV